MSLTRRWSEAGYLSQFVLTHALRQASVSLIFDVRRKMRLPLAVAVLLWCVGCHYSPKLSLAPRLESSLGKQVVLVGIAEPRKGGAALRGEDFYVWLKDLDFWPDAAVMKKVEVVGRLEEDQGLPVFVHNPDDPNVPQGIPVPPGTDIEEASRRLVIVQSSWRVIE